MPSITKYQDLAILCTLISINLLMWVLLIASIISWFTSEPAI